MSHSQGFPRRDGLELPEQFDVMINVACNARCPFCVQEATFKSAQGTDNRYLDVLAREFALFYAAGGRRVVITGGEPTLDPQRVLGVLNVLRPYVLEVKALYTNGARLLEAGPNGSGTLAAEVAGAGLGCVNLSVHSTDEQSNAAIFQIRNRPATVAVADHLARVGLPFRLNLTLQRGGVEDAPGLLAYIEWADRLGACDVYVRELFRFAIDSPQSKTNRDPIGWSAEHRVALQPVFSQLCQEGSLERVGARTEVSREKQEDQFIHRATGMKVTTSRLVIGTERRDAVPYLVLMPDAALYRGWLGETDRLETLGDVPRYQAPKGSLSES